VKFIVTEEEHKKRLDLVLSLRFSNVTRAHIKKLIEEGKILLSGKVVKAGEVVKLGQEVSCEFDEVKPLDAQPEDVEFDIVYEDKDLLVINKPQGLVVHPCASTKSGTLVNGLLYKVKDLSGINGVLRPGIVHRLDKNTSGLMLVAKNDMAHVSLAQQIKNKTCVRKYLALLEGNLKEDEGVLDARKEGIQYLTQEQGTIDAPIGRHPSDRKKMAVSNKGKLAMTKYKIVSRYTTACLVEFSLKTGRTHQIRVHAKELGHPVIGDDVYGHGLKGLNGQLLHSYYITFVHPRTLQEMHFEVELPSYFKDYISKLKTLQ